MPKFVDRDGKEIQLDGADAVNAFLGQQVGLADGRVNIVGPDGDQLNIDAAEAGKALESGYRFASDVEVEKARLQAEHGTGVEQLKAGAEGLARGVTFGLSDAALTGTGMVEAGDLKARKEANPLLSTTTELAGALAPLALSGGGSAGASGASLLGRTARAAGAIPRGTAAVGRGAEAAANALMGSRAGTLVGKAASLAAGGAVEGAIVGAGQAVSQAALDDVELTAEQLIAGAGEGALLGGIAGGALGAASVGASKAAKKLADVTPDSIKKAISVEAISSHIDEIAGWAAKGPGGGKRYVKAAEKFGGLSGVGKVGLDEGIITKTSSIDDIVEAATVRKAQLGEEIGASLKRLDDASGVAPSTAKIGSRIVDDVISPLEKSGSGAQRRLAKRLRNELDGQGLMPGSERVWSFQDLHQQRRVIDELAFPPPGGTPTPFQQKLQDVRRIVEDELETAGDVAAKQLDDVAAQTYKEAKRKYSVVSLIKDMSHDAAERADTNRLLSLSDMMFAVGGGGIASVADGPDPGTLAAALLTGFGSKLLRTRGAAFVAGGLHELRAAGQVTNAALKIERATDNAVKAFFKAAPARVKRAVPIATVTAGDGEQSLRQKYDSTVADLGNISPDTIVRSTDRRMGASRDTKLSAAYSATMTRGVDFLRSKRPDARRPSTPLRPRDDDSQRVSDAEMHRFMRYAEAVKNPMSVIEGLADGSINRQGVEALREVYPSMYQSLVARVIDMVTDSEDPLPYDKTRQLSLLIGQPLHPSLTGEFIAFSQSRYSQQEQPSEQPAGATPMLSPSRRKAPDFAASMATDSQAREMRGNQ